MAKQHKAGSTVVFIGTRNEFEFNDITLGKPYTIQHDGEGDEYFIDDANDKNYCANSGWNGNPRGVGIYVVGKLKGEE